jgi:hypothetical protein
MPAAAAEKGGEEYANDESDSEDQQQNIRSFHESHISNSKGICMLSFGI